VQRFIRDCPLADRSEFTLVDFESNAMQFVAVKTAEANAAAGRRARITTTQMSVNQLIKESLRSAKAPLGRDFDMVYCVGLFDYLPVKMCQQLTEMFHEWTIPGGLVAVANMKDEKPYRHMVEHLLDWHLLYRSAADMAAFVPASVSRPQWSVVGEQLAVNLFLEIRKAD
jgi:extracellular factor (EF) 3-hydroxypalmitic acid methyl ester biosynthesis protein